jgi:hypothetical protein
MNENILYIGLGYGIRHGKSIQMHLTKYLYSEKFKHIKLNLFLGHASWDLYEQQKKNLLHSWYS